MMSVSHIFDFSKIDSQHQLYSRRNQDVPGIFKYEYPYAIDFIKLKPKTYAVLSLCQNCKLGTQTEERLCHTCSYAGKTTMAKGVPKNMDVPFDIFVSALEEQRAIVARYSVLKMDKGKQS